MKNVIEYESYIDQINEEYQGPEGNDDIEAVADIQYDDDERLFYLLIKTDLESDLTILVNKKDHTLFHLDTATLESDEYEGFEDYLFTYPEGDIASGWAYKEEVICNIATDLYRTNQYNKDYTLDNFLEERGGNDDYLLWKINEEVAEYILEEAMDILGEGSNGYNIIHYALKKQFNNID